MLYACKGVDTLFTGQREIKREIERDIEREIEREREGGREKERVFLKGMTGALASFSYLVCR